MSNKREKVTISIFYEDIVILEKLKERLFDTDPWSNGSSSEVVRVALHHLYNVSNSKLAETAAKVTKRRPGKKKQPKFKFFP